MTLLTGFGLISVSLMMLFDMFEDHHPWCTLGFAVACLMGSAYGFLQGAWPFGVVEALWGVMKLRKFWQTWTFWKGT